MCPQGHLVPGSVRCLDFLLDFLPFKLLTKVIWRMFIYICYKKSQPFQCNSFTCHFVLGHIFSWVLAWLSCQTASCQSRKKCRNMSIFSAHCSESDGETVFYDEARVRMSQMVSLTKNTYTETPQTLLTDVARLHSLTHIFSRITLCLDLSDGLFISCHTEYLQQLLKGFTSGMFLMESFVFDYVKTLYRLYIYL